MPRHTHPRPIARHSRAHVREQRRRKVEQRYQALRREGRLAQVVHATGPRWRWSTDHRSEATIDATRRWMQDAGQVGPVVFIHAEQLRRLTREDHLALPFDAVIIGALSHRRPRLSGVAYRVCWYCYSELGRSERCLCGLPSRTREGSAWRRDVAEEMEGDR